MTGMRVAIVHEWLSTLAGSERVLEGLIQLYPTADLFVVVDFLPNADRDFLQGIQPKTTFIQKLPFAKSRFRQYLPLMPLAVEQWDLSRYDLIISSHHAVAHGVITGPDQCHISYVHSPMRYAWDLQHQYLRESALNRGLKGLIARYLLHRLRLWDVISANRVDFFIANSDFIRRRIHRCYRRPATVIHPPVRVSAFNPHRPREAFYLTASRLVPYKRIDLIVEAFSKTPHRRLIVIGDGPQRAQIQRLAGPNITLLGHQPDAILKDHLERTKAFVFAAEEDFGLLPVEAQAAGAPVIAFGKGGVVETVIPLRAGIRPPAEAPSPTGVFFETQSVESLLQAVDFFEAEAHQFHPSAIRAHADPFDEPHFQAAMQAFIKQALIRLQDRRPGDSSESP